MCTTPLLAFGRALLSSVAIVRTAFRNPASLLRALGLTALALAPLSATATDRWEPETWFNAPVFQQYAIVERVVEAPDGRFYVSFYNQGIVDGVRDGSQLGGLMRLNSDGSIDDSFSVGPDFNEFWAIAVQADGKIVAGGIASNETSQTGTPIYRVWRFNTDGSVDDSFNSPIFEGMPRFITLFSDNSMIVVPSSSQAGNGGIATMAYLEADGSMNQFFTEPDLAGGVIFAPVATDGSGGLYIAGIFSTVNGIAREGVARLNNDGSLDLNFAPTGFVRASSFQQIRGIALQTQGNNAGKVIIAGGNLQVPGDNSDTTNRPLIRLNTDGTVDTSFNLVSQLDAGMNPRPRMLEVLPDDTIVIAGRGVARFDAEGNLFAAQDYTAPYFNNEVFWMEALDDGSVIVPPQPASTVNDNPVSTLVKFAPDGSVDGNFNAPDFVATVYPGSFHTYDDGRFLVWGNFESAHGETRPGIARFWNDGNLDGGFAPDLIAPPAYVTEASVADDGKILVSTFNPVDFSTTIARLNDDGSIDNTFTLDSNLGGAGGLNARQLSDGKVIVTGLDAQRLIDDTVTFTLLDSSGTIDNTFNAAGITTPGDVFLEPDDSIRSITLGDFTVLGEDSQGRLIVSTSVAPFAEDATTMDATLLRINRDGTIDNTFTGPTVSWPTDGISFPFYDNGQFIDQVQAITTSSPFRGVEILDDDSMFIYGFFRDLNNSPVAGVAKLTSSGSVDGSFSVGNGPEFNAAPNRFGQVTDLHVMENGRLFVAGYFDSVDGDSASGLIQLESNGQAVGGYSSTLELVPYTGGDIGVQRLQYDDIILVGGTFRTQWWQSFPQSFSRVRQIPLVELYAQPKGLSLMPGQGGTLRFDFTDPQADLTFQWFKDGVAIDGATDTQYFVSGSDGDIGNYYAEIYGGGETIRTDEVGVEYAITENSWVNDPGFSSPEFVTDRYAGRVVPDGNGGYYASFVNGSRLTGANGQTLGAVVRLNGDGSVDSSFNIGTELSDAWAILPLSDGSVLVGGEPSTENFGSGFSNYYVFKFNASGERDYSFNSPRFGGLPRFMTQQPDGKVLVVPSGNNGSNGGFQWMTRINADGSWDDTFNEPQLNSIIFAPPAVDGDGKIYIGGFFTNVNGVFRPKLARLNVDGSLDDGWYPDGIDSNNIPSQVRGLAFQTEGGNAGKLLVAGGALNVPDGQGGTFDAPVIRLNTDGSLDNSFTLVTQADAGMAPRPRLLRKLADDSFLVVGRTVTKFLADGAIDNSYTMPDFDAEAFWFAVNDDGSVVVPVEPGTNYNGSFSVNFVKLQPNGAEDTGFTSPQFELFTFPGRFIPDGDSTYVIGGFDRAGGVNIPGIAKLNYDGSLDSNFSVPSVAFPNTVVFADLDANGRIVAAVSDQNTGERSDIIRLNADGSLDGGFVVDPTLVLSGIEILTRPDNSVLIWSDHPQYIIDDSAGWGLLMDNGTVDDNWGPPGQPVLGQVYRFQDGSIENITQGDFRVLAVADDGSFIARRTIGDYPQWANNLEHTIKRYNPDGTEDLSFNAPTVWWGTGFNAPFVTDASTNGGNPFQADVFRAFSPFDGAIIQDDGKVIIYGSFNDLWGFYRPGVARLNADGSVDESFVPSGGPEFLQAPWRNGSVSNVSVADSGRLWVTGFFDTFSGYSRPGIALLESDGNIVPDFGTDLEFLPWISNSFAAQPTDDGTVLVGGSFEANGGGVQAFHRLTELVVEDPQQLYWRNPQPVGGDLYSVISDGNGFVAVGGGSRAIQSADGETWSDPAFFPEELMNGIAFDGTTYATVGGGGTIYTSTDLSTWTFAYRDDQFRWLQDIDYSGGLFVAVGDGGIAVVSGDGGATWTGYDTGVNQTMQKVAAGAGQFVTVSWGGVVLYSADGQSWTQAGLPSGYESTGYHSVDFVNNEFIVFGENGAMLRSSDGINWTGSMDLNGEWLFGVAYVDSTYVAITGDARVFRSTNLTSWDDVGTSDSPLVSNIRSIAEHNGTLVIVGAGNMIRSSSDAGLTWTERGSLRSTSDIFDVAWFDDGFHAVGSSATYLTSSDSVNWNVESLPTGHWLNAIARGAGATVIATGYGDMVVDTGSGWQELQIGDNNENRDLIFAEGLFYAVGANGTFRTSSDGTNWNNSQITGYEDQYLQSIAVSGGVIVIVGDGGLILRSDDGGANWTDHSTGSWQGLAKVRYLDGLFVAVGQERTVLLSADGMTWDPAPVPNDYDAYGWAFADVGRGPDAYYVVSSQGRVVRTTDWSNWTPFWGIASKPDLLALAGSSNRLVVGGKGGAILSTGEHFSDGSLSFPSGGLMEFTPFANRGSASLSVFATGPGDLTYAWDKDGVPIPGANLPFLSLSDLSLGDAGLYTVTVTSSDGPILTSSTELVPAGFPDGDGPIFGVGDLPGGGVYSEIRDAIKVNDVIYAVGGSATVPDLARSTTGILWRSDEGLTELPNLVPQSSGTGFVTAASITPDASLIAARGRSDEFGGRQATRISTGDFSVVQPVFPGGVLFSASTTISDDGNFVGGFYFDGANLRAFIADYVTDGATLLDPILDGHENTFISGTKGLSADGSVAVGNSSDTDLPVPTGDRAFRYTGGPTIDHLPLLGGGTWNQAKGVTPDGLVTLLTGDSTEFPNGELYLHDSSDDSITRLGSPDVNGTPQLLIGMTSPFSVVAGAFSYDDGGESSFIYNSQGWFAIQEVVTDLGVSLDGWDLHSVTGISRDGCLVFGRGTRDGVEEGFVIEFPENYLANYAGETGAVLWGLGGLPSGDGTSFVRDAIYSGGGIAAVGNGVIGPEPGFGSGGQTGFFWSLGEGLEPLPHAFPDSSGTGFVAASALTPDGNWIAARTRADEFNARKATRVNTDDLLPILIPEPIDIAFYSAATAISDDANLLGGFYVTNGGVFRGFIADVNSGQVTTINPDDRPEAEQVFVAGGRGLSADGSVAVGNTTDNDVVAPAKSDRGFRYTSGTGLVTLPLLDGGTWSQAAAVSGDGQITLLSGDSTAFPNGEMYMHNAGDGSVTPLGSPNSDGYPGNFFGMSSDSSVIGVSFANVSDDAFTAYIWNQNGWFTLQEVFAAAGGNSDDWILHTITGISRDGRLAFGAGDRDGVFEGFVMRFPENFLATYGTGPGINNLPDYLPFAGNTSVTLDGTADGVDGVTYQWFFNGSLLNGETNPMLVLSDLNPSDEGEYRVDVSDNDGVVFSASTFLDAAGDNAGPGPIYGIGHLPGGVDDSTARDATRSGNVVFAAGNDVIGPGYGFGDGASAAAFWRSDEGLYAIPSLEPEATLFFVAANAITPDGRYVAARTRSGFEGARLPTRFDSTTGSNEVIPFATDHVAGFSSTITDDGSIVGGSSGFFEGQALRWRGFVYDFDTDTVEVIDPALPESELLFIFGARSMSADGSVLVGYEQDLDAGDGRRAIRYQSGVGTSAIPLIGGGTWSESVATSGDGSITLVRGDSASFPNGEMYLHNAGDDSLIPLGSPESQWGPTSTWGMTSDASVIVGSYVNSDFTAGLSYLYNQNGWFELDDAVVGMGVSLDGWQLYGAHGVSRDGRFVYGVGQRNGIREGFVVEFPEGYLASYREAEVLIFGIGNLPSAISGDSFVRDAVSVNGNIHATGQAQIGPMNGIPPRNTTVYWTLSDGIRELPQFEPNTFSGFSIFGSSITPDASTIVGRSRADTGNLRVSALWNTDDLMVQLVPPLDAGINGGFSAASTISDDGSTLAGFYAPAPGQFGAFIADVDTGDFVTLTPDLPNSTNVFAGGPRGLSADGSVLVGNYQIDDGNGPFNRGYRYTDGGGFVTLPLLPGGSWNLATAVTPDGQVSLLVGDSPDFPLGELYLHDNSDGSLMPLGSPDPALDANSFLIGMTADTQVQALRFLRADTSTVSYIRNSNGWFALHDVITAAGGDLGDWDLNNATGISPDGLLVFGSGDRNGEREGFVVEFAEDYLANFDQLPLNGPVDPEIVGAWRLFEGDSTAILIFTPDGHYAHMQDVNTASPDEMTGFELGRFEFNLDGSFIIQTDVDTNGDIGMSDTSGRSDLTAAIANNQLSITIPNDGTFTLDRIVDDLNSLVGAWGNEPDPAGQMDEVAFIVFDDQGRYYHLQDGVTESNAQPGIEWGSYTWDSQTGAFSAINITIDQNGEFGLSDPAGPTTAMLQDFGFRVLYNDGEEFSLRRVAFAPVDITTQPMGDELDAGENLNLSVEADGNGQLTYQWRKDGQNLDGETGSTLVINGVTGDDAGTYDVIVTSADGSVLSAPAIVTVEDTSPSDAFLRNLSVRHQVPTGGLLALPFRIEGSSSKELLLRAVGPALADFGVNGTMPDPRIHLLDSLGFEVAVNDDWEDLDGSIVSSTANSVGAFALPSGSADAAMVTVLAPGSYTLLVDSAGLGGVVLAEIFDAEQTAGQPDSRLVYLAALGDTSVDNLVPGFVVSGNDPADLLLRAVGPGTGLPGASSDPSLSVLNGSQQTVAQDDDWDSAGGLAQDFNDVGAFPLANGSTDAATDAELAAGIYTAQVGGSPGRVLVEVYDFQIGGPSLSPSFLLPPLSQTVASGVAAEFEALIGGHLPIISLQWMKDDSPISGANSATYSIPSASAFDEGDYKLRVVTAQGTFDSAPATLTVLSGPTISTQPADSTIQSGDTATLNVAAVSQSGGLTYQWYEGQSGDTSVSVSGATGESFTTPALSTTTSYWVRVSDNVGSVDSDTATVTVQAQSDIFATHGVLGGGYVAGGTVTISTTFTYAGNASALGVDVVLPAGWSYASSAGDNVPPIPPNAGDTGTISWAYLTVPGSPVSFTYTLNVPAGETETRQIAATFRFRDGSGGEELPVTVTPSPLLIDPAAPFHTGDTNQDGRFSLSELLRVIQLYNTRNGTSRTGAYKVVQGTEDGFDPNPDITSGQANVLAQYHAGDFNQDGKFSLSELLRVIQLYNYRTGTTRTGEYRPEIGTEDGFAPGPETAP